ncbi:MAG: hypothetical protein CMH49_08120 [Myxococcales bacterium]|nr:hypothetical protein [Myxococcales bacterium]
MNSKYQAQVHQTLCWICISLMISMTACTNKHDDIDQASVDFMESVEYAPAPQMDDATRLAKADVIVLPTISLSVYVVGALVAYIGSTVVYQSLANEGMSLWDHAWSGDHLGPYEDFLDGPVDLANEAEAQMAQLNESLAEFAYRSEDPSLPGITGEMYLTTLNAYSHYISIGLDAAQDIINGRVKPLADAPRAFLNELRMASIRSRGMDSSLGFCIKARVLSKENVPYVGRAKARGVGDVIRATVLASLKATTRCGLYHEEVMAQVREYATVADRFRMLDQFFFHLFVTGKVLYAYAGQCTLPPEIEVLESQASCEDPGWL